METVVGLDLENAPYPYCPLSLYIYGKVSMYTVVIRGCSSCRRQGAPSTLSEVGSLSERLVGCSGEDFKILRNRTLWKGNQRLLP